MRAPPFKRKNIKNNLKMMNVVRKKCLKRILQVPLYAKRAQHECLFDEEIEVFLKIVDMAFFCTKILGSFQ